MEKTFQALQVYFHYIHFFNQILDIDWKYYPIYYQDLGE
jgi:hypothetical protein